MLSTVGLDQMIDELSGSEQRQLRQGDVVLTGDKGTYSVWALVQARAGTVWDVLTAYEEFSSFLPAVASCRILEQQDQRTVVERRDKRKIGWMPIKVKIVTENIEVNRQRIDYRMLDGTLDAMAGSWRLAPVESHRSEPMTLLVQEISAKASMGPLQKYFYEVFETGLVDTTADLRAEMERRASHS